LQQLEVATGSTLLRLILVLQGFPTCSFKPIETGLSSSMRWIPLIAILYWQNAQAHPWIDVSNSKSPFKHGCDYKFEWWTTETYQATYYPYTVRPMALLFLGETNHSFVSYIVGSETKSMYMDGGKRFFTDTDFRTGKTYERCDRISK
jgi:hypothetical protein